MRFCETRGVIDAMAGSTEYDKHTKKELKRILTQPYTFLSD